MSQSLWNSSIPSLNRSKKLKRLVYKQRYLLAMLIPAVIITFVFNYLTLLGWVLAFKWYQPGVSIWKVPWAGIDFFVRFFKDSGDFTHLMRNTLVMNFGSIAVCLSFPFVFAILLNELKSRKYSRIVQTVTFFPFFISWIIVYSIMLALFGISNGAVNETLVNLGILDKGINILGDARFSWWIVIFMTLWKSFGYNGVIFISAISSISSEQYESAEIDGANRWKKVIHITIPNLMPTFIVLLVMNSGWILNSNFELYYLFTNPTNIAKMDVLDMYTYRYGLQLGDFPYATAVGIMKSIVSLFIIFLVNAAAKKWTGKSIL